MYVCMHVCMYACMHVCMYACMHVCMYVCMYACMHVCMYACSYVRTYVCRRIKYIFIQSSAYIKCMIFTVSINTPNLQPVLDKEPREVVGGLAILARPGPNPCRKISGFGKSSHLKASLEDAGGTTQTNEILWIAYTMFFLCVIIHMHSNHGNK